MNVIGVCFGATTLQCVELTAEGGAAAARRVPHEGNPAAAFADYLRELRDRLRVDRIAVTGRAFRKSVALSSIPEPEAVLYALRAVYAGGRLPDAVVSAGGETQMVYIVNRNGGIGAVLTGNKCASGTGEFFLQQVRRMGLTCEEAVALAATGTPHPIAGRCSVFCKSDCTHALNKGESKANIAAGLCLMMAGKLRDLIKSPSVERIALIGGGSRNAAMVGRLREYFPRLEVPPFADCFEAYGAALWALAHDCRRLPVDGDQIVSGRPNSFSRHHPLSAAAGIVDFKPAHRGMVRPGDECVLGLDVGSTTTKAVLMRLSDRAIVAAVYLRTNGDPVAASRECYAAIRSQTAAVPVAVHGLGVTGSGRQIAALHGRTEHVVNEIIAHAAAAAYYDPGVDTIFEIGGQDAKFTRLINGIAADYAMNEACSAGTGSFLEESARESLAVAAEEIATLALRADAPPNFTDQCAAFISSDIKVAGQEGIGRENILAGLVYSICLNYLNRVKGSRPVGKKIFMQGGVCYNRAVPLAMAALVKAPIVVPPDPGLMGAFGVALEVAAQLEKGCTKPAAIDLGELAARDAIREGSFVCGGGGERCDRKCEIQRIRVAGDVHPFGGVCNRYYNLRLRRAVPAGDLNLVALRQRLLFEKHGVPPRTSDGDPDRPARTVGLMRSFLIHSFYPLYSHFFDCLGFSVVFPDAIDPEGIRRTESAFCLPAEIAHGSLYGLLRKKCDYIFLPQVSQLPVPNVPTWSKTCVFVQGEPYYLRATFRNEIEQSATVLLTPVLRKAASHEANGEAVSGMAVAMGVSASRARDAWHFACERQRLFEEELQHEGRKALAYLETKPDSFGVVLFGRPYSAFSIDAHKGIPSKIASRGFLTIPFDMLPAAEYPVDETMFWATGQKIMKAAQFVRNRDALFGVYVTNFSCGPDAFLLGYFRRLMGTKPSLTLEVDQHTADAGIDTRVEAALDIMKGFRGAAGARAPGPTRFRAARVMYGKEPRVISSDGRELSLNDPQVEIVLPSMGRFGTEALAAVMRGRGLHAIALPVAGKEELIEGRTQATCRECLPYLVTSGSFLAYLRRRRKGVVTLLFLPTGGGPCRLGQYRTAIAHTIERNRIENTAVLAITDENGYAALGARALLRAWQAIVVSDCMEDMRSMLSVAAEDRGAALAELEKVWKRVLLYFEGRLSARFLALLSIAARRLSRIPLNKPVRAVPVVSLVGEIFVRRDEFSRKNIVSCLEENGFMVRVAPVAEYLCYSHYVVNRGLGERAFTASEDVRMRITARLQEWWERRIKTALARSGLYKFEMIDVSETIRGVRHLVNVHFRGEAVLTVGLAMREILHDSCGVIAIGPFGCMPSRVSEAILKKEMNVEGKERMPKWKRRAGAFRDIGDFPFLSIETDGMPFPQIVEANIEAFIVQARRMHEKLSSLRQSRKAKRQSISAKAFERLLLLMKA